MADRVGFEPTVRCRITGFQDRLLKPLGHLSVHGQTIARPLRLNYFNTLFMTCQVFFSKKI